MRSKSFFIFVSGRVQGIFFRKKIKRFCDDNGVKGFVKNELDGKVLILVQCNKKVLNKFLIWLESSKGFSRVDSVILDSSDSLKRDFTEFKIIRNGNWFQDKLIAFKNLVKSFF